MNLEEQQIEVLLSSLLAIDETIDGLIERTEDNTPYEQFQQLKGFSKQIKIALNEALCFESDWPFDKENILPLIDMANNVAQGVEAGDMEGEALCVPTGSHSHRL